jgi:hypothetical protein
VGSFLNALCFPPPIKPTDNITEILLIAALNVNKSTINSELSWPQSNGNWILEEEQKLVGLESG